MANPVSTQAQPTEDTVRLAFEGMNEADRLARYYHCLARRFGRLGEFSSILPLLCSWAALVAILSPFPRWAPVTLLAVTIAATLVSIRMRFHHLAFLSGEIARQMGRLSTDWVELSAGRGRLDDAELRGRWRTLSQRQRTIVIDARLVLPQSKRLMRRCRLIADEHRFSRNEGEAHEHPTR